MATRTYGQFCGLVRALDIVGERWALLIVRDLVLGPKRFTDLRAGLPKIPTNVLSARLKELEQSGVVRRRLLPRAGAPGRGDERAGVGRRRSSSGAVYELTEYGRELEDILLRLGLWGAQSLGDPAPGEIVTPDSLALALHSTFQPAKARGVDLTFEVRAGPVVVHAHVHRGHVQARPGAAAGPVDLAIETGPVFRALLAGEVTPAQALEDGSVRITGDPALLDRFVELFHIPACPNPSVQESTEVTGRSARPGHGPRRARTRADGS